MPSPKSKNLDILDLRPTQFVLGLKEIESKVANMRAMDSIELREYCQDHVIPAVLGPSGQIYMIDHHHFARACWETNTTQFKIKVIQDLSSLKEKQFWNTMNSKGWVYLHDQFGLGPHLPASLPVDVRGMADDPYRSLAWALRDQGYIKKVNEPFFEFKWAAFFRLNLDVRLYSKSDFKDAIAQARILAKSKEARGIPGFVGG
jgi:hypothetical protein